jgi:uracil-DNA glycosylase
MVAPSLRVIVCLGRFAWNALWPVLGDRGHRVPRPRPAFGHGAEITVGRQGAGGANAPGGDDHDGGPLLIVGCYHPSQQNTFTGRVTPDMIAALATRPVCPEFDLGCVSARSR